MTAQDHAQPWMRLRAATLDDRSGIAAVLRAAYAPYADLPGLPDMTADVAGDLARSVACVAEAVPEGAVDRAIVGVVMWSEGHKEPDAVSATAVPLIHIIQLAVHPDMGGRGLGRRLLDQVTQAAQAAGVSHLALGTHVGMTAARRLYARTGWHEERRRGVRVFLNRKV